MCTGNAAIFLIHFDFRALENYAIPNLFSQELNRPDLQQNAYLFGTYVSIGDGNIWKISIKITRKLKPLEMKLFRKPTAMVTFNTRQPCTTFCRKNDIALPELEAFLSLQKTKDSSTPTRRLVCWELFSRNKDTTA